MLNPRIQSTNVHDLVDDDPLMPCIDDLMMQGQVMYGALGKGGIYKVKQKAPFSVC